MKVEDEWGSETREIRAAKLDYEQLKPEAADRLKYQMEFAHAALRGLTLANGGAIVALFTFIGNTERQFDSPSAWRAFGLFAGGLALCLTVVILAYLAQGSNFQSVKAEAKNQQSKMLGGEAAYDSESEARAGWKLEIAAIICTVLSLASFVAGAGFALAAGLVG